MGHVTFRFLVSALWLLGATHTAADSVFTNFTGYTLTPAGELQRFNTLRVNHSGKVVTTDDAPAAEIDQVIDLGGRFLLPGLIDAHGHVVSYGASLGQLNLNGAKSIAEVQRRLKMFASNNPDAPWIIGQGWNQELWPQKIFPSRKDLDAVVSDRPVVLSRVDGHALWTNSTALAIAELEEVRRISGGVIYRDEDGQATGVLVDAAMDLVWRHMPFSNSAQVSEHVLRAARALNAVGLTSVHDAGADLATLRVYLRLARRKQLNVRIYAMARGIDTLRGVSKPVSDPDTFYELRSVKLVADGALGSRGALLQEPYIDAPTRGLELLSLAALRQQAGEAAGRGFQVNVHAIGDLANRHVLETFAQLPNVREARHRVEHAQIVNPKDLPLFAKVGAIASMQSVHATSDMRMAVQRLGDHRIAGAYAWRTLLDLGVRIANGSDFPVEDPNPFHGLHAAVTRQDRNGQPVGGWKPKQRMTRLEALRSFTLDAAYAAFQEERIGTLTAGRWADFIVVDRDFFAVEEAQIADTQVLETWVSGRRVYAKGATSDSSE